MTEATGSGHALIRHQEVGNVFEGVYYVESVFVKKTVQNKDYSDIMLRDRSGARSAKYWGVVPDLKKGDWVFASVVVEEYLGNPSLISKNIERTEEPEDKSDYIPVYDGSVDTAGDFDAARKEIARLEEAAGDSTAGRMVDEVYGNAAFLDKFLKAPGSARPHYGRQGGLLANTVRVAGLCARMSLEYGLSDKEKLVLMASAMLCRVGAIDAFEFKDCMPALTKKGLMLGMANLTMARVSAAFRRASAAAAKESKESKELDHDIVLRVMHAVASHDPKCVLPMTKEAMVLNAAQRVDSEMVEAMDFISNDQNLSEEFTAWDASAGRRYYVGERAVQP